jgi:hypothetical protein
MTTEYKTKDKQRRPAKVAASEAFEKKLGVAAYQDPRSVQAASDMIEKLIAAELPAFDQNAAVQQQKYADLFGKDAAKGAGSAGQVGKEFATVLAATKTGNLRERMTAIYNATLSTFKTDVLNLMQEEMWETMAARGLDVDKLKRRKQQIKFNPGAKDLYRDPGNPLDRKHMTTFEPSTKQDKGGLPGRGNTRTANPDGQRQTQRTVAELDADGVGLSEREKRFMYKDKYDNQSWLGRMLGFSPVGGGERLTWIEGGTYWKINENNKWVRKCKDKLHMPVTAGPSGTALRLFQAWEFLSKPAVKEHFRLALLGWMMTSNDHSFHEIMMTSAEYGMPYEPGLTSYRKLDPFNETELRAIASPHGFPDEENYKADHMTRGAQNSVLVTDAQISRFNTVIASGSDIWAKGAPPSGGELAHAMAVLVYTDEGEQGGGISTYKFINNVLKGNDNAVVMLYHLRKDPDLKAAYDANKFNIKQLVEEAKLHASFMQEGLKLLKPFTGQVFRGETRNTLPKAGETWTERKFFSMSKEKARAEEFVDKGKGRYHLLVTMTSVVGRDIGNLTMFPGEGEVIFPHGSQFRIANDPVAWPAKGANHYQVTWSNHG